MGDAPLTVGSWALGRRLARYRDEADLTGTEVAKKLGVSQATVTRIEKGKHRLTPAQLTKLCTLYRIGKADAAELERARVLALQPDWRQDYGRLLEARSVTFSASRPAHGGSAGTAVNSCPAFSRPRSTRPP